MLQQQTPIGINEFQFLASALSRTYLSLVYKISTIAPIRISNKLRQYLIDNQKAAISTATSAQTQVEIFERNRYKKIREIRNRINTYITKNTTRYADGNTTLYLVQTSQKDKFLAQLEQFAQEFKQLVSEIEKGLETDLEYIGKNTNDQQVLKELITKRIELNNKLSSVMQFTYETNTVPIGFVDFYNQTNNDLCQSETIRAYEKIESIIIVPVLELIDNLAEFITAKKQQSNSLENLQSELETRIASIDSICVNLQQSVGNTPPPRLDFFIQTLPAFLKKIRTLLEKLENYKSAKNTNDCFLEIRNISIEILLEIINFTNEIFQQKPYAVGNFHNIQSKLNEKFETFMRKILDEIWCDTKEIYLKLELTQNTENPIKTLAKINEMYKNNEIKIKSLSGSKEAYNKKLHTISLFISKILSEQNMDIVDNANRWKRLLEFIQNCVINLIEVINHNEQVKPLNEEYFQVLWEYSGLGNPITNETASEPEVTESGLFDL